GTGLRIVREAKPEAAASGDPSEPAPAPDEGGEGHLIEAEVLGLRLTFRTAPGVFSHRRLDEGTVLLLETLGGGSIEGKKAVADLGCGYGPIGIALAARYPHLQVTMVDVDARAVSLAQSNAALNGVAPRTRVLVSDGLGRFPGGAFDAVVIAFPLHIPKGEQVRLLTESREALRAGGAIYLAALCEYDIRPTVQTVFGNVETLAETPIGAANRYRVLRAHT
ncbi:MAG: class I SAM-dependent methyltransferase, partial [Chloroflexota bacterium]